MPIADTRVLKRQGMIGVSLSLLIIASWSGLHIYSIFFYKFENIAVSVALVLLLSWLSVGLFIVAHDAMHRSLSPLHPQLNDSIGRTAIFLYAGFLYHNLKPKHFAHHALPGSADDPDFHSDAPRRFWRWYYRFFKTYFGWSQIIYMTARVIIYWLIGAQVINIILFFALPGLFSSLQLFLFGTWLPHRHSDSQFIDGHNARSNHYPAWLSLLTCFHFGYHHEHHLSPKTPWWELPRKHLELNLEKISLTN